MNNHRGTRLLYGSTPSRHRHREEGRRSRNPNTRPSALDDLRRRSPLHPRNHTRPDDAHPPTRRLSDVTFTEEDGIFARDVIFTEEDDLGVLTQDSNIWEVIERRSAYLSQGAPSQPEKLRMFPSIRCTTEERKKAAKSWYLPPIQELLDGPEIDFAWLAANLESDITGKFKGQLRASSVQYLLSERFTHGSPELLDHHQKKTATTTDK